MKHFACVATHMEGSALSLPWQAAHPGIDGAMPSIPACNRERICALLR